MAVTPTAAAVRIMEALARRFDAEELCDRIQDGLDAMTPGIVTKDGKVITRPDYSTRLRYIELLMAYQVGRPIERQMTINASPPATLEDLLEKARKSPVFRATLQDILRGLETAEQGAG